MKYEIVCERTTPQVATIIIEAESEEEAEHLALESCEGCEIVWEDCEPDGSAEIIQIREYEENDVENM